MYHMSVDGGGSASAGAAALQNAAVNVSAPSSTAGGGPPPVESPRCRSHVRRSGQGIVGARYAAGSRRRDRRSASRKRARARSPPTRPARATTSCRDASAQRRDRIELHGRDEEQPAQVEVPRSSHDEDGDTRSAAGSTESAGFSGQPRAVAGTRDAQPAGDHRRRDPAEGREPAGGAAGAPEQHRQDRPAPPPASRARPGREPEHDAPRARTPESVSVAVPRRRRGRRRPPSTRSSRRSTGARRRATTPDRSHQRGREERHPVVRESAAEQRHQHDGDDMAEQGERGSARASRTWRLMRPARMDTRGGWRNIGWS